MAAGLRITNANGSSFLFNERCTLPQILGSGYKGTTWKGNTWCTGVSVPERWNWYLWLNQPCLLDRSRGGGSWRPTNPLPCVPYLNEQRQVCWRQDNVNYNNSNWWAVYAWPMPSRSGRAGLLVKGGNVFASISDVSRFMTVAWKGEIALRSGWLPTHIDPSFGFNDTMVFFYQPDPAVTVSKVALSKNSYQLYNASGGEFGGTVNAKVVIFKSRPLIRSRAGLRLYNAQGEMTFDSGNEILILGGLIKFKDVEINDYRHIEFVSRPMIMPGYIGAEYNNRWFADVTLKNNGYALAPAWGYSWYDGSSGGGRTYATTENPIMVIDAANYFTF
ncbi:DUF6453 family protein [Sodalis endosymbiont of Spalangia cameroni]|uniref:DUF6453 family protein n=1 Tax=Sodalis praecaptivus TaxID=1239307 RepID=UPI0031F9A059